MSKQEEQVKWWTTEIKRAQPTIKAVSEATGLTMAQVLLHMQTALLTDIVLHLDRGDGEEEPWRGGH